MTDPRDRLLPKTRLPMLVDRLPLGRSGLGVSPICQGMTRGDDDLFLRAFDAGINFFFVTCDLHWRHYASARRGIAKLLQRGGGIRDEIVIACASYAGGARFSRGAFLELLEEVPELGHIDVLVAGGCGTDDFARRLDALQVDLLRGHCGARAIGASFHDRGTAALAQRNALVDIAFARYNPAHPGAVNDLFPLCSPASPTLLFNFKSMDGAFFTDEEWRALGLPDDTWRPRPVDQYRFAMTPRAMDGLLCALNDGAQVEAIARAFADGPLAEDEVELMVNLQKIAKGEVELG